MKSFLLHIRTYIIISLFLFLSEITATSIILLFPGLLIDSFINNKLSLINMIILYIVTFSIYLLITYISNRVADYRRIKFEKKIKQDFFESIMRKSFLKFYEYDLGEYISMQSNDITQMCQNYLSPLLAIFRSIIMIIIFGISLIIFTDTIIAIENLENLSSGEKQIIAIIRAFCSEKEFIILDEALSVMNQITIEKFMETIFNLNKSIVIIAHNVDEYKDRFYKTYKVIRKEI